MIFTQKVLNVIKAGFHRSRLKCESEKGTLMHSSNYYVNKLSMFLFYHKKYAINKAKGILKRSGTLDANNMSLKI